MTKVGQSKLPSLMPRANAELESVAPKDQAVVPDLAPANFRALPGTTRVPSDQNSAMHVKIGALLDRGVRFVDRVTHAMQAELQDLESSLGQLAQLLMSTQPQYVYAGGPVPIQGAPSELGLGDGVLQMSTIGEMISGSLRRKCPGEMLDREYEDVVKLAKQGNKAAKTAKKLAEQGDRLRAKNKGKRR